MRSYPPPPPPPNRDMLEDPEVRIDRLEEENCLAQEQLRKVQEQCEKMQKML